MSKLSQPFSYIRKPGRICNDSFSASGFLFYLLSFAAKKTFHQFGTFFFHNTFCNLGFGMKRPVRLSDAFMTVLFIIGSPDDLADLAPVQRPSAHKAWFYRNINGTIGQIFTAKVIECRGE